MNGAEDLSLISMIFCGVLLIVPLGAFIYFKLGMAKRLLISALRMSVQLLLIGFFLEYLFKLNNWAVNILWFLVMLVVAVVSVINNSKLNRKYIMMPMIAAFVLSNLFIIVYFNLFIVRLDNIFDAKYIIAVGGMILGNSIRSNVVGLGDFYQSVKRDETQYHYRLSLGASKFEALLPFAKKSFMAAIFPMIATMATMGIVSLPGMMTGQILGGSVPMVAIKYQIAIMVAIMASTVLSIGLSLFFTSRKAFLPSGVLRKEVVK